MVTAKFVFNKNMIVDSLIFHISKGVELIDYFLTMDKLKLTPQTRRAMTLILLRLHWVLQKSCILSAWLSPETRKIIEIICSMETQVNYAYEARAEGRRFTLNGEWILQRTTRRHVKRVTIKKQSESRPWIRLLRTYFSLLICWKLHNSPNYCFKPSDADNSQHVRGVVRSIRFLFGGSRSVPFSSFRISNIPVAF